MTFETVRLVQALEAAHQEDPRQAFPTLPVARLLQQEVAFYCAAVGLDLDVDDPRDISIIAAMSALSWHHLRAGAAYEANE